MPVSTVTPYGRALWRVSVMLLAAYAPVTAQDTLVVAAENEPAWGAGVTLSPHSRIGSLEGPEHETFGWIEGIVEDGEGTVYIADSQLLTVRAFSADGGYLGIIGRSGAGPGEYLDIAGIAPLPGNRVAIQDARLARVVVYAPGLRYETGFPLRTRLNSINATFQTDRVGHSYVRARVLGVDDSPGDTADREWRYVWIEHDSVGMVLDSITAPPLESEGPLITSLTASGPRLPFTVQTLSAISPAGYLIWGRNDRYALHWRLANGRVVQITRDEPRLPVSRAERSEWTALADYFERTRGTRHPPVASQRPYFRSIHADVEGRIWVERYTTPRRYTPTAAEVERRGDRPILRWREAQSFDVFEPRGSFLGSITLPPRTQLAFARGMRIWAIERGAFDEQYAVSFTIQPGDATGSPPGGT